MAPPRLPPLCLLMLAAWLVSVAHAQGLWQTGISPVLGPAVHGFRPRPGERRPAFAGNSAALRPPPLPHGAAGALSPAADSSQHLPGSPAGPQNEPVGPHRIAVVVVGFLAAMGAWLCPRAAWRRCPERARFSCCSYGAGYLARLTQRSAVHISAAFDGGNVECVDNTDCGAVRLRLRRDPYTAGTDNISHAQWFYFRTSNVRGRRCGFSVVDAGEATCPAAWHSAQVCASYDRQAWFRVPTTEYGWGDGSLKWTITPSSDVVWFAFFAPYSYPRHERLITRAMAAGAVLDVLGSTLQGRPVELLSVGAGPLQIWVLVRQHPGEPMGQWLAEGLLEAVLHGSPDPDPLLRQATLRVVPNMNPDGAVLGHFRANASGANLNREWADTGEYVAPTAARSPEVLAVKNMMDAVGCDMLVDLHGDGEISANYFVGAEGIPGWTPRLAALHGRFAAALAAASPDFQTLIGRPPKARGTANLAYASNYAAQRFGCLAVLMEQPFRDTLATPDAAHGWSPPRAKALGAAVVEAMRAVVPHLRQL